MNNRLSPTQTLLSYEAFFTGIVFGQFQVTLGMLSLQGAGATVKTWFLSLLAWLCGGVFGSMAQHTDKPKLEEVLSWSSLFLLWGLHGLGQTNPFSRTYFVIQFLCALCAGAFAGGFLARRTRTETAFIFFQENNGFVLGLVSASGLLLFNAPVLLPAVTILFLVSRLAFSNRDFFSLFTFSFGLLAALFQYFFREGSTANWDGLMTASTLLHSSTTPLSSWFFFAHPLVIPITLPFNSLCSDPLDAVVLRETVALALLVMLLCYAVSALCKSHKSTLFAALFGGLLYLFSVGRYTLATSGEEKDISCLFSSLFVILYFEHCGYWKLRSKLFAAFSRLPKRTRTLICSVFLTLSVLVHLTNGVLLLWVAIDTAFALSKNRRSQTIFSETFLVLAYSTLFLSVSLFPIAIVAGGARSFRDIASYFFQYHLSGDYLSWPTSFTARLSECAKGIAEVLAGKHNLDFKTAILTIPLFLLSIWNLYRRHPLVVSRMLFLLSLLGLHFFFYEASNYEGWAPTLWLLCVLVASGLGNAKPDRYTQLGVRVNAALLLFLLACTLGKTQAEKRDFAIQLRDFTQADTVADFPFRQLVGHVNLTLEPDAEIVVEDRLLASYFHLYTKRRPVVQAYVGKTMQSLRREFHLTDLSLHFYFTHARWEDLAEKMQQGHPVYFLGPTIESPDEQILPWPDLYLSRITEPERLATLQSPKPLGKPLKPATLQPNRGFPDRQDLLANDLQLLKVDSQNPTVFKLTLMRNGRVFSAKWKPMGLNGSEEQEGIDGNNSPRCELAAREIDRNFAQGDTQRELVPEVVLRAFHRNISCSRACQAIPKLMDADIPATFPQHNDHLVLGILGRWIEDAIKPTQFEGDFWEPHRYDTELDYRRQMSSLFAFLFLISHGDANYADNFLASQGPPYRVYSIDNGRSLDGIHYYVGQGDPDWEPLRRLSTAQLNSEPFPVVPYLPNDLAQRTLGLTSSSLVQSLYLVSAIHLPSGRSAEIPFADEEFSSLKGIPLSRAVGLSKIGRGTYLSLDKNSRYGGPWLLQGVSEQGVSAFLERVRVLRKTARPIETVR